MGQSQAEVVGPHPFTPTILSTISWMQRPESTVAKVVTEKDNGTNGLEWTSSAIAQNHQIIWCILKLMQVGSIKCTIGEATLLEFHILNPSKTSGNDQE